MKLLVGCLGLCGVGVALIFAGLLWVNVIGDAASWDETQALKFNEVSATYHQAAHAHSDHSHAGHNHGASAAPAPELAAAKAAWQEQMQARDKAIGRRAFWKNVLLGSGMAAILLGGIGYLLAKNVMEDND
jgi:hypothetical protein